MKAINAIRAAGLAVALGFVVGVLSPNQSQAGTIIVDVDPRSGPWNYVGGGLNDAFQYGIDDHLAPTIVDGTSGIQFIAGEIITVSAPNFPLVCAFGAVICTNGLFDDTEFVTVEGDPLTIFENDTLGSSGQPFPSFFMDFSTEDIELMALVGTFANGAGEIVGTPFKIGLGPRDFSIPAGATQLQLGFNDDVFFDNVAGQLNGSQGEVLNQLIPVSVTGPMNIPEPGTLALLGAGVLGIGLVARYRRSRRST